MTGRHQRHLLFIIAVGIAVGCLLATPAQAQLGAAGCIVVEHCAAATWTDNTNPSGTTYNAYVMTGACPGMPPMSTAGFTLSNLFPVTALRYTFTLLSASTTYCFTITAVYMSVESTPATPVQATTGSTVPITLSSFNGATAGHILSFNGIPIGVYPGYIASFDISAVP